MILEERIQNIKRLLEFCPFSTDEVKIVEEKVGLFFANLFNNDERFEHTPYDHVYPRIYLSENLNADHRTYSTTIAIEYVYDSNRDGWSMETVYFNDKDLEDAWFSGIGKIEYSEVPDEIWEIIQNELYKKATKYIREKLDSAKKSVKYWKNKSLDFDNLNLNNENIKGIQNVSF